MLNIAENSKQVEYLMAIRDVGMQIVFRRAKGTMVLNEFVRFDDYFEDQDKKMEFIKSLELVHDKINAGILTPDDLLFELGQYTPYIIYNDKEEDLNQTALFDDDDNWLYN